MIDFFYAFKSVVAAHMKLTMARSIVRIALFVQPIVIATTTFFIYRNADVPDYVTYVFLGGGMAGVWSALTFSSATDLNRERYYGTLSSLTASPTSLWFVFAAKTIANGLVALSAPVINVVYTAVVLSVTLQVPHVAGLLLAILIFILGSSAFALCLSAAFLYSRSTGIFMNTLEYGLLLLSGVVFPITILPEWLQVLARLLPMTWGMEAMRLAFQEGALNGRFYLALGWCLALGAIYMLLSSLLFRAIERMVRREATLELY